MSWTGFIGLGTVVNAVFKESTAAGYARQGVAFGSSVGGKIQAYGNALTFTASSPVVTSNNAYAFYNGTKGGAPLFTYNLSQTFPYGLNVEFVLNPYSILLNLLDNVNGDGMPLDMSGAGAITGAVPSITVTAKVDPKDGERMAAIEARLVALEAKSAA